MEGIYGVPGVPSDPPPADPDQREVTLLHQVLKDDAQLFDRSTTWPMHHKRAASSRRSTSSSTGETSPEMVKAIFMASKLPGLTLSEFFVRWEHVHGPLAAKVPGLRHYDQYHAVLEGYADGTNTHDGWSELWFDDVSLAARRGRLAGVAGARARTARRCSRSRWASASHASASRRTRRWTYHDWGVGDMSEDDVRALLRGARLRDARRRPGRAAARSSRPPPTEALAVWTDEHLVTFDASAIDARPGAVAGQSLRL